KRTAAWCRWYFGPCRGWRWRRRRNRRRGGLRTAVTGPGCGVRKDRSAMMGFTNDHTALPAIRGGGALLAKLRAWQNDPVMQRIRPKGLPVMYGDEDFEIGESTIHTITAGILLYGLGFHFAAQTAFRVFGNLNLYYSDDDPSEYLS